mgnify:CR=1 FL=1
MAALLIRVILSHGLRKCLKTLPLQHRKCCFGKMGEAAKKLCDLNIGDWLWMCMILVVFVVARKAWGLFLESPETFRVHFGWHNSLCIFKTKASRGTKLSSYFYFYSLYNIWEDQLYRISRPEFDEWLFGPEKLSGLSRNRPLNGDSNLISLLLKKRKKIASITHIRFNP